MKSGVLVLQIITFILVILPVLFIITVFQNKNRRAIVKKDYGVVMGLSIVGVFLGSILIAINDSSTIIIFCFFIGCIGALIVLGIFFFILLFFFSCCLISFFSSFF